MTDNANSINFFTISDSARKLNVAKNIVMREQEIHSYDINVVNYTHILNTLPSNEWPDDISFYRNSPIETVPDELHSRVSDYQFRDRIRQLIATEKHERNKSIKVYNALVAQLSPEEVQGLIAQVMKDMNLTAADVDTPEQAQQIQ